MADDRFGIFAESVRVKVTNEPRMAGEKARVIPGQVGFRQRDKSYVNEWFDVIIFQGSGLMDTEIKKGDVFKVSGRVDCSEYQGKKQWKIYADTLEYAEKKQGYQELHQEPEPLPDSEDVPF
jgi:hypothetical protein